MSNEHLYFGGAEHGPTRFAALIILYNTCMKKETGNTSWKPGEIITRDFILIFLSSIFYMGSLYSLIAILPLYMQQVAGAGVTDVGLLMGTITITSFLLRPVIGRVSDRLGRKPVLFAGSGFLIAASLLYKFAQSTWTLVPLLIINGASIACFHTASLTYAGDISPEQHRGKAMTWYQVSYNLGIMVGPLLGLYLKNRFSYAVSFAEAAVAAVLSLVFLVFISHYGGTKATKEQICDEEGVSCDNSPLIFICIAALAGTVTLGTIQAFLPLFAETVDISNYALFFTIQAGAVILIRLAGAGLPDRLGMKRAIIGAMVALGLAMFILAGTSNQLVLSVSALMFGIGFSFHPTALSAQLVEIYPQRYLGRAFGFYTMAFEGGFVVGSMAMGPVAAAIGFRYTFLIVGSICIMGMIVFGAGYGKYVAALPSIRSRG